MTSQEGDLKAALARVLQASGCDFAILGGSVATGNAGWWSDIDIFVHHPAWKKMPPLERSAWLTQLSMEMELASRNGNIDVHAIDDLPLHVQFNVISTGLDLYDRDDGTARATYTEWLLPRYYDHVEWYRRIIDERIRG
ncbi:MAG: nucleotidyltransferase domain-containing protein [Candidatus Sigynarchaeota archaeon]